MKAEFYDTAFRKKIYPDLQELQEDVDFWLSQYNNQRAHSGKYCYGKTPFQTFLDSKKIALEKTNQSLYHNAISDSQNLYDNQIG